MVKIFTLFVIIIITVFFQKIAAANSAEVIIYSGGSARMVSGEHKSIQMKSELIEMYLYEGYYRVIATFYFENNGDSTTALMGFPEISENRFYSDSINTSNYKHVFSSMKSYVDGNEIEIKPYSVKTLSNNDAKYLALWVKKVHFEKNQKRKVVVDYTVNQESFDIIEYNFTGGNWYKNVEKSKLIIYPMGSWKPSLPYPDGVKYENGVYIFEKSNWEAEYTFRWGSNVKTRFKSTLTEKGIYDVYNGKLNGYTYASFYYFKDYQENILYVSPINFIFPPYKYQNIDYSWYEYTEYYPGNILRIDRKEIVNGEYYQIADFIDLNKSFKPEFTFTYYKYFDGDLLHLFKKNNGKYDYFFIRQLKTPSRTSYTDPKPEHDSIRIILNREEFTTSPYRGIKNNNDDIFYYLDSNASSLKIKVSEYYSFFEKFFAPGEYIDNLEAYVLQMIFIGKEDEGWKFFEENFPFLCSKEKSKKRIQNIKQEIYELRDSKNLDI